MENGTLEVDKNLKLIAKTSVIAFITIMSAKLLVYVYRAIIARYFGPEIYGVFSLAIIVSSLFAVFASFGAFEGLVRYISMYIGKKQTWKGRYLFDLAMKILIVSSIAAAATLFFASDYIAISIFHNEELIFYLRAFSLLIPLSVLIDLLLSSMRAHEIIGWYSFVSSTARNGIKVLILVLMIFIGVKSNSVAYSEILGAAGTLLLAYLVFNRFIKKSFKRRRLSVKEAFLIRKDFFYYSIPLTFSTFIFMLFNWIDTFAVGYFKTAIEVGFYNAAVPIAMLMAVAPDLFMRLFFPLISREYSKNNMNLIKELSKQTSKWIFLINVPALVLMLLFPGAILNILFGSEYLVAENALRILAVGFFLSTGIGSIGLRLISMAGKSKMILLNTVIACSLNFILNFTLVPMPKIWFLDNSNGLIGAAIGTLISLIVMVLLFVFECHYYLSIIPVRRKSIRIFLAVIIPTIILIYVKRFVTINLFSMMVLALFFFLAYVAFALLFKALDRYDLEIICSVWRKIKSAMKQT